MEETSSGNLKVQNMSGVIALAEALQFNSALISVNLLQNDLGDGAAAIVAAAKQQSKIKTLCGITSGQTKVDLSGKFGRKELKAPDAVLLSFDLEFNRALTDLNLRNTEIGVEGVKAIAEVFPKCPLISVNLLRNDIGVAAAAVTAAAEKNGKIKTLCGIKPDQTEADFSQEGLEPADAQLLAFDLKFSSPLKVLNLASNDIGGVSGYIKKDKLQGTSFKKGDTVQYNGQQCIVYMEETSSGNLKVQNMSGVIALAEALQFNSALTSVNLLNNSIGKDGASAILHACKSSTTLKTVLGLADQTEANFRGKYWGVAGAILMSAELMVNSALTSLNLYDNNIGVEGGKTIAEVLPKCPLKNLNLCWNDLGSESKTMAQAVLQHTTMEVFCEIPIKDLHAGSLTELDLSEKGINDHGAIVLADLIKVSSRLNTLDLSNNNIGGVSGYIKKDKLQGTSFKKGDTVQYNGQQCIVFMEEDSDGDLKHT
eukprot:g6035.t1